MPSPPNQIYWNSEWRTAREICLGIASSNGWARLHQIAAARGGDGHCKKVQLQQLRLVHVHCARSPVGWFDLQKFRNAALDTCRRTLGEEDRNISSRYEQVSLVRGNMFFRGKLQVCVILGFFPQLVKLQVVGTLNI